MSFRRGISPSVFYKKTLRLISIASGRTMATSAAERRHAAITGTVLSGLAGRGMLVLSNLLALPLFVHSAGKEAYGVWALVGVAITLANTIDFGFGQRLLNVAGWSIARNEFEVARHEFRRSLCSTYLIALFLVLLVAVSWRYVAWTELVKVENEAIRAQLPMAIAAGAVLAVGSLITSLFGRLCIGFQVGLFWNSWLIVAGIAGLAGLTIAVTLSLELKWIILFSYGTSWGISLAGGVWIIKKRLPWLHGAVSETTHTQSGPGFGGSGYFLLLQLSALFIFQKDYLLIGYLVGAGEVAKYSLLWNLFLIATYPANALAVPLWTSYAESLARADTSWVRATFRRALMATMAISGPMIIALATIGGNVVNILSRGAIHVSVPELLILGSWGVIYIWMVAIASVINATGRVALHAMCAAAVACCSFVLSVLLVPEEGAIGAIRATLIAYLAISVMPLTLYTLRILGYR